MTTTFQSMTRTISWAVLASLLTMAVLGLGGCGSAEPSTPVAGPGTDNIVVLSPDPTAASTPDPTAASTPDPTAAPDPIAADQAIVSGYVTTRDNGAPYEGAIVEFRNVYGGELHTTTDSDGFYSITLPSGVYNAFALDLEDLNAAFEVTERRDSIVTVPPADEVNFVAFPLT